jgi:hypothetical protein
VKSRGFGAALLALSFASPAFGLGLTIIQEDMSSFARDDLLDAKCYQADWDARDKLRVTVAGQCVSSCALCRPRNPYFCSAPNTELWFHSSPAGTEYNDHLTSVTSPAIRAWIIAKGGLKPTFWGMADSSWLVLKGEELQSVVPLCAEWSQRPLARPQAAIRPRPVSRSPKPQTPVLEALKLQQRMNAMPLTVPPSGSWPSP